jgi:beta-N-acetylhexosaminidase
VIGSPRADVPRGLPLPRAAAKVFAVGFEGRVARGRVRERLAQRDWGALLVTNRNYVSPSQLRALSRSARRAARRARHEPPLVAANPALIGNLGPRPQVDVGADGEPEAARAEARAAARRLRAAGVGLVLAPNADLGIGGGPAEPRAFGDDPRTVARFVREAVAGWNDARVAPAPGRFPGEGGASQDPLVGAATVGLSRDELIARDVRPFAGVVATAPAMQMSAAVYAAWDGVTPATLLADAVRLLRGRLGFRGVVVSADLVAATAATGGGVGDAAVEALKAGCDLLLVPGGREEQDAAYRAVLAAVRTGVIPRARLDEAAARVRVLARRVRERR